MSKITVEALIEAPLAKVWQRFTQPEHITKWNFASDDWCCPRASNDLRVGGRYSARMEAKDGSFGFDFTAIYDEVVESRKLRYTMEDGRQVVTEFATENGGVQTSVRTVFDAETMNSEDKQRGGWQAILNNFKRYAEQK